MQVNVGYPPAEGSRAQCHLPRPQARRSLPFDPAAFSLGKSRAVYDMVYRPAETPLLTAAAEAGCKTANGLGMLLHQGAKASKSGPAKLPLGGDAQALKETIYG